jgi:hypothetical protein
MKKLGLFISVILMICLVFTASCVSKEISVTETYYETEYRTEYYTVTESVPITVSGTDILIPEKDETRFLITGNPPATFEIFMEYRDLCYELPQHDKYVLELNFRSPYEVLVSIPSQTGYLTETILAGQTKVVESYAPETKTCIGISTHTPIEGSVGGHMTQYVQVKAELFWTDTIETEGKEVTKERRVPVLVEKQRTVMQTKRVPFWEAVFR